MEAFHTLAAQNQRAAWAIFRRLGIEEAWRAVGADVHLVGSLKTGLQVKHRDIDVHVYTTPLTVEGSFAAMARLAARPGITAISYINGMHTDEHCLEWHCRYLDEDGRDWQIDIIHILKGSTYDGHFERVAERILAALTPESKDAIMRLKYETPDTETIAGITYCKAVLDDGVRTWPEFERWRAAHADLNLLDWMP